jgi:hypothetical protein
MMNSSLHWLVWNIMLVGSTRSCFTNIAQLTMPSIISHAEFKMMHSCSISFMRRYPEKNMNAAEFAQANDHSTLAKRLG